MNPEAGMAEGKWIDDIQADTPALAAARHVLEARLAAVKERLPRAVHQAEDDVEHVHQLRVSTRRAGAALRIFADLLPPKRYRKVRRQLRRLRRAAGEARDWDVFLEEVSRRRGETPSSHRPGIDFLLGLGHGRRMAAQTHLQAATQQPPLDLDLLIQETLGELRLPEGWPKRVTLANMAGPQLAALIYELEEAASGDLADYAQLHQVRILGKRLRYAMEVFAVCYPPDFRREHYAGVEAMQEILGLANDSHVAVQRLADIKARLLKTQASDWKRLRPGIEGLLRHHAERLPEKRAEFLDWWRHWRRAGGDSALLQLVKSAEPVLADA